MPPLSDRGWSGPGPGAGIFRATDPLTFVDMSIREGDPNGHDRDTGGVGRDTRSASGPPAALLRSTLDQLRLEGAIFFRSEFTEGFAFESTPLALAETVDPSARRLILFHIVACGSAWVSVEDGERHWASEGDVIVLPYGDRHTIGGKSPAEIAPILSLLDPTAWDELQVLRHGGGGERTDLVCGYLSSPDPLFDPALRALPPVFVVTPPPEAAAWVEASVSYALEHSAPSSKSESPVATRLPELVLVEMLRAHLSTAPAAGRGWVAALRDPVLAPALSLLHAAPERRWTVAELANETAVSRSLLDDRFRNVLGESPIRYLTEWRMHVAQELLATTDLGVLAVARRVGYDSEASFSRAFKRATGASPGRWRTEHSR